MQAWARSAEAEKIAVAALAAAEQPQAPQLPAALEKCLKRSLADKRASSRAKAKAAEAKSDTPPSQASADALVLAKLDREKQRQACAAQLLAWHEKQRTAKAAKK